MNQPPTNSAHDRYQNKAELLISVIVFRDPITPFGSWSRSQLTSSRGRLCFCIWLWRIRPSIRMCAVFTHQSQHPSITIINSYFQEQLCLRSWARSTKQCWSRDSIVRRRPGQIQKRKRMSSSSTWAPVPLPLPFICIYALYLCIIVNSQAALYICKQKQKLAVAQAKSQYSNGRSGCVNNMFGALSR